MRIFVLLLGGLLAVLGSEHSGFGGAGPLAVILAAYVASSGWEAQGWKVGEVRIDLYCDKTTLKLSSELLYYIYVISDRKVLYV